MISSSSEGDIPATIFITDDLESDNVTTSQQSTLNPLDEEEESRLMDHGSSRSPDESHASTNDNENVRFSAQSESSASTHGICASCLQHAPLYFPYPIRPIPIRGASLVATSGSSCATGTEATHEDDLNNCDFEVQQLSQVQLRPRTFYCGSPFSSSFSTPNRAERPIAIVRPMRSHSSTAANPVLPFSYPHRLLTPDGSRNDPRSYVTSPRTEGTLRLVQSSQFDQNTNLQRTYAVQYREGRSQRTHSFSYLSERELRFSQMLEDVANEFDAGNMSQDSSRSLPSTWSPMDLLRRIFNPSIFSSSRSYSTNQRNRIHQSRNIVSSIPSQPQHDAQNSFSVSPHLFHVLPSTSSATRDPPHSIFHSSSTESAPNRNIVMPDVGYGHQDSHSRLSAVQQLVVEDESMHYSTSHPSLTDQTPESGGC